MMTLSLQQQETNTGSAAMATRLLSTPMLMSREYTHLLLQSIRTHNNNKQSVSPAANTNMSVDSMKTWKIFHHCVSLDKLYAIFVRGAPHLKMRLLDFFLDKLWFNVVA